MANQFKGKVQRVISKPTRSGGKLWLVAFPGDGNLFNAGFKFPEVAEGDTVSFEWKETKFGKEVVGNIEVVSSGPVSDEVPTGPSNVAVTGVTRGNAVQDSINWQSARRDAVEVACFMVTNGLVKAPTAQNKKQDFFLALVDTTTAHFFRGHDEGIVAVRNDEEVDENDPVEVEEVEE